MTRLMMSLQLMAKLLPKPPEIN